MPVVQDAVTGDITLDKRLHIAGPCTHPLVLRAQSKLLGLGEWWEITNQSSTCSTVR